jgi:hypothetical protein
MALLSYTLLKKLFSVRVTSNEKDAVQLGCIWNRSKLPTGHLRTSASYSLYIPAGHTHARAHARTHVMEQRILIALDQRSLLNRTVLRNKRDSRSTTLQLVAVTILRSRLQGNVFWTCTFAELTLIQLLTLRASFATECSHKTCLHAYIYDDTLLLKAISK